MTLAADALQPIDRAPNAKPAPIENVRVYHRRSNVTMTEEFLHSPNIGPVFEQMRRERVAQRMTGRTLRHTRRSYGFAKCALNHGFMQMMPPART